MAEGDSGKILEKVLDLATGKVDEIAEHQDRTDRDIESVDFCLRGDKEGRVLGLVARVSNIEKACRQNHGNDQRPQIQADTNRMEAPRRSEVIWTVDKIITAIVSGVAVLIASFGALTATCNRRDLRRDDARWHRSAHVQPDTAETDTAGP